MSDRSRVGFGPSRLAAFATRRPRRVLAVWGVAVVVSLGLTAALLDSGLSTEGTLTNHPQSVVAKDLIDARLANENKVDEVIVVRSEQAVVSDAAYTERVSALVREARASGSVTQIRSYLDPGGKILASADRHAAMLPLALGIDYSLFIVSRLREERHRGSSTQQAIMTVANTATRAVVFSGTAFTLAMIGMLLVPETTLRSLGFGAVMVGVVSIAVALTFHPAVLMVLGDRIDRARLPWLGKRIAASSGEEGPLWRRAILVVLHRPALSLTLTTVLLLAAASPLLGLKVGASGSSSLPDNT